MDINHLGKIDLKTSRRQIVESWTDSVWAEPKKVVLETLENMEKELGKSEVDWKHFLYYLNPELVSSSLPSLQSQDIESVQTSQVERKALLFLYSRMDPDGDGYVSKDEFEAYMMASCQGILGKTIIGLFLHIL